LFDSFIHFSIGLLNKLLRPGEDPLVESPLKVLHETSYTG